MINVDDVDATLSRSKVDGKMVSAEMCERYGFDAAVGQHETSGELFGIDFFEHHVQ